MWRTRKEARVGDTVKIRYTGTCEDGTVCLSSVGRRPLEFTIGRRRLIVGIENAVVGMRIGETRTVTVPPEDAFGERREGLLITVDKAKMRGGMAPAIGQRMWATCVSGRKISVTVVEVSGRKVTLDTNHPLAGKIITFQLHLVAIV